MAILRDKLDSQAGGMRVPDPGCVNPTAGRRLLAYSLGRLSPAAETEFEAHLLACDHCFEALRGLDQIEAILRAFVEFEAEPGVPAHRS